MANHGIAWSSMIIHSRPIVLFGRVKVIHGRAIVMNGAFMVNNGHAWQCYGDAIINYGRAIGYPGVLGFFHGGLWLCMVM